MTHVLISITDWENLKSGNVITFVNVEARNEFLVNLVEKSKQISLEDIDIEQKAHNSFLQGSKADIGSRDRSNCELKREGYRKALEDLKTIK